MKYIFLFLLLIPSFLFSQESNKITPNEVLHKKALYPTVKITVPTGVGSGFIVRSEKNNNYFKNKYINVIITANHLVQEINGPIKINVPKYKKWSEIDGFDEYQASIHSTNKEKDFAILFFSSPVQMPVVDLDLDSDLFIGTELFKIGYGLGDDVRLDFGHITSVKTVEPDALKSFMRTNAYTIFGDSGGPVFSKHYKVIAITHGIRGIQGNVLFFQSYISSISGLKEWNESLNNGVKFVFDEKTEIPLTTTYQLWLKDYNIIGNRK